MADTPTAAQIAAHFSAMDDTEALSVFGTADEVKLMITRNTDHLELQATHSWYSDSSKSKTPYTGAVTAGKAYVAG